MNSRYNDICEGIFKAANVEELAQRRDTYIKDLINNILRMHGSQNADGSWDITGGVDIAYLGLTKIPVKFNTVSGYFDCHHNQLTSLEGVSKEVIWFDCSYNNLISLNGAPKEVRGDFYCAYNKVKFTIEDVSSVCKVGGKIYV